MERRKKGRRQEEETTVCSTWCALWGVPFSLPPHFASHYNFSKKKLCFRCKPMLPLIKTIYPSPLIRGTKGEGVLPETLYGFFSVGLPLFLPLPTPSGLGKEQSVTPPAPEVSQQKIMHEELKLNLFQKSINRKFIKIFYRANWYV